MTSNVLPLFWHLASSSKDTRLQASAELVSSLEGFQQGFVEAKQRDGVNGEGESSDEEDDEDEDMDDDESGEEVEDDDDNEEDDGAGARRGGKSQVGEQEAKQLESDLARHNAEDVVYTVKRLIRGLGSSRESSRLGFAVALTELLSRIPTVSARQALSLLLGTSHYSRQMKGSDERDMLFARLFGLSAIVNSGCLVRSGSSSADSKDWSEVIKQLLELGKYKGWLRESAWWILYTATDKLLDSEVGWKADGIAEVLGMFGAADVWTPERVALLLLIERKAPEIDLLEFMKPTLKHLPVLASSNLVHLARILKETDAEDDESGASSTGSWKPQLHFVWDVILDSYFKDSAPQPGRAPFPDLFRVVVDESLFSNTSAPLRKFWGFSLFTRSLPMLPPALMPQLFTPNLMRTWMNNLASPDRYLHKAAQHAARTVQDVVKANPTVGFALLCQLVGKHGRMDFDKVTRTKTVETIMSSLNGEGVGEFVKYLQGLVLGGDNSVDASGLDERRQWALDQLLSLCRNGSVPKEDQWTASILDFLLLHGFFTIRKADKKSAVSALHAVPKPPLSDNTATLCRSRFFSCIVELTTASPSTSRDSTAPARQQGCDASGKLWLSRALELMSKLETDKHVEVMMDADEEIKSTRTAAANVIKQASKVDGDKRDLAKGIQILLSFILLQTHDENEDALEMLEEVSDAARQILGSGAASTSAGADGPPAIDSLLDVLIQLLDKGSNDLRNLANMVVGMVAGAFEESSIQHLIAQLEQTVASAAAADEDENAEEGPGEGEGADEEEEDAEISEDESDEDEEDDDDDDAPVDPAFRQRVAEALQVSGMALDPKAQEEDEDEDEEEEVWDDDQMMKVDEQLAAVFRQHTGGAKRSDMKHLQIESQHFKSRILDFFDVFLRRQPSNPLVLSTLLPLLRLARASTDSSDLSAKTAGILRSRIAKAKDTPSPSAVDSDKAREVLAAIHELVRKGSAGAEFSTLCSACSLFVVRSSADNVAKEVYGKTIEDFLTRKSSDVHPTFVADFVKRYPLKAWALWPELVAWLAPGKPANVYRHAQGFGLLASLGQQLPAIGKARPTEDVRAFVGRAAGAVHAVLQHAAEGSEGVAGWKADRLKEVVKAGLQIARGTKSALGGGGADAARVAWGMDALASAKRAVAEGERTKEMKGVVAVIAQLEAVLGSKGKGAAAGKKVKGGKKSQAQEEQDKMDVDEVPKAEKKADKGDKKRKSAEGKKPVARAEGDKPKKKKRAAAE